MPPASYPNETTVHVRAARNGDTASLTWIIERFTPLLLAQARRRLPASLAKRVDPADVVQDTWAIAIPKLAHLADRTGSQGEAMIAFLSRILIFRVSDLLRKHVRGKPVDLSATKGGGHPADRLPALVSGVVTGALRRERECETTVALASLPELDRDVILMRGLECHPVKEIAAVLGVTPNAVSLRYRRALATLRERLPGSVFDTLLDEE